MTKQLHITTKSNANKMQAQSLLSKGGTCRRFRYDSAKYASHNKFIGTEITVADDIVAVYVESRSDFKGSFKVLYCLTTN